MIYHLPAAGNRLSQFTTILFSVLNFWLWGEGKEELPQSFKNIQFRPFSHTNLTAELSQPKIELQPSSEHLRTFKSPVEGANTEWWCCVKEGCFYAGTPEPKCPKCSSQKTKRFFFPNALKKNSINYSQDKEAIDYHVVLSTTWTGLKTFHVLYSAVQLSTPKYQLIGRAKESQHQKTSIEERASWLRKHKSA